MRRTRLNIVPPASKEVALSRPSAAEGHDIIAEVIPVPALSSTEVMPETTGRETKTQKVRRLQEEARSLAKEQIAEFEFLLDATTRMAQEIADGGDVYPVGAREVCRRLAEELPRALQTLKAVAHKS
jgi:hypothetical protein